MREKNRRAYSKRCMISHRPPFRTGEPVFYRCPDCGTLLIRNTPAGKAAGSVQTAQKNGDQPENGIPKDAAEKPVYCCGNKILPLQPMEARDLPDPEEHEIGFTVFGGFEENALRVLVGDGSHPMREDHRIEWIYCRTFQGGQLKYLPTGGRAAAVFAFGDEDAYVYCDREICRMGREHCQFCCKRGNILYAYCTVHGLIRLEMDGF